MTTEQVENALGGYEPHSLKAWQDERASILKTKREQIDGMQTELTRLREENRVLREQINGMQTELTRLREENRVLRDGLVGIAEDVISASQAYAETALAAADKIRGGV